MGEEGERGSREWHARKQTENPKSHIGDQINKLWRARHRWDMLKIEIRTQKKDFRWSH